MTVLRFGEAVLKPKASTTAQRRMCKIFGHGKFQIRNIICNGDCVEIVEEALRHLCSQLIAEATQLIAGPPLRFD